jgi:vanillate/3-O-methylgallate O-demethylase
MRDMAPNNLPEGDRLRNPETQRKQVTLGWNMGADGKVLGLSLFSGYSANEKRGLSLATVDQEIDVVTGFGLVWGEPDGGTRETTVEPHTQQGVRVVVSPVAYSEIVHPDYAGGWRSAGLAR